MELWSEWPTDLFAFYNDKKHQPTALEDDQEDEMDQLDSSDEFAGLVDIVTLEAVHPSLNTYVCEHTAKALERIVVETLGEEAAHTSLTLFTTPTFDSIEDAMPFLDMWDESEIDDDIEVLETGDDYTDTIILTCLSSSTEESAPSSSSSAPGSPACPSDCPSDASPVGGSDEDDEIEIQIQQEELFVEQQAASALSTPTSPSPSISTNNNSNSSSSISSSETPSSSNKKRSNTNTHTPKKSPKRRKNTKTDTTNSPKSSSEDLEILVTVDVEECTHTPNELSSMLFISTSPSSPPTTITAPTSAKKRSSKPKRRINSPNSKKKLAEVFKSEEVLKIQSVEEDMDATVDIGDVSDFTN